MHGGAIVSVPKICFRTKYEPVAKERVMGENWNPTRLGEYLLASEHTPEEAKLAVARKMRSAKAKAFVANYESTKRAGDTMLEQLHSTRKASKLGSGAQEKHDARTQLMTKYVAVDAAMPSDLYELVLA